MEVRKHAVISGATHGIGKAIAGKFLAAGFDLSICARNAEELTAVINLWKRHFPMADITMMAADMGNREAVESFASLALKKNSVVDVLVNNAGSFLQGDILTEPDGQLRKMLDVNLMSAYHLSRAIVPAMTSAAGAHIFNICSIASLKAYPGGGAYSISKYALLGFSDNLREELKPRGIRVTAVCPGAVWTRSWSESGVEPSRIMEAQDVAQMVWASYSLSPQADVETIVMRPTAGDL